MQEFHPAWNPTLNRRIKSSCRSSLSEMLFTIGVLKNFANFTEKHLCWSLFLMKLETCNFMKKRLQHSCFPVNFFWLWRHKLLVIYYIRDSFNGFTPSQFWFCQAISCRYFVSIYMTISGLKLGTLCIRAQHLYHRATHPDHNGFHWFECWSYLFLIIRAAFKATNYFYSKFFT